MKLLSVNTDAKTKKGIKLGYLTGILYLAPHTESGFNTCQYASKGCSKACLFTAGYGAYNNVKTARIAKTKLLFENRDLFFETLIKDIHALIRKAKRENLMPCVRLNGTSDLPWHKIKYQGKNIMEMFPTIQFYDYTKDYRRIESKLPKNYQLTFSRSESNEKTAIRLLKKGINVAVVFRNKLPDTWKGKQVVNGDLSDVRFIDPVNSVIGLKEKGMAKKDLTGFVVEPA